MTDYTCTCGYEVDTSTGLADHLGEAFIPLKDDIGTDGQAHAERIRDGGPTGPVSLACLCGLTVPDSVRLDEHLLRAFTPANATGLDGRRHAPAGAG